MSGVLVGDAGMNEDDEEWGTIAAAVLGEGSFPAVPWTLGKWNQGLSTMWEGFISTGLPAAGCFEPEAGEPSCTCIGARRTLPPLGEVSVTFLLGWHFPNRRAWAFAAPAQGRLYGRCCGELLLSGARRCVGRAGAVRAKA